MNDNPTRCGAVIILRPEKAEEYRRLHSQVWPKVEDMIRECNMRHFSIFQREFPDGRLYLFMVYDYVGTDQTADNAKMAADPVTQEWWKLTDPCQQPLENCQPGEWWAPMEEVCRIE